MFWFWKLDQIIWKNELFFLKTNWKGIILDLTRKYLILKTSTNWFLTHFQATLQISTKVPGLFIISSSEPPGNSINSSKLPMRISKGNIWDLGILSRYQRRYSEPVSQDLDYKVKKFWEIEIKYSQGWAFCFLNSHLWKCFLSSGW